MDLATLLANNGNIPAPATPKAPKGRKVRKPKAKPFAAPMTPQDAQAQVNSQANMRYGSQYGALGQQIQDVGRREAQVPVWFANYKAELAARNAANKARYDAAIIQVNQQGQAQQAASNAQTDQQQAAMQADAASRGATAGAQPFNDARTGTTNTGALQTAFAALLGTQSQAQQDYGSNMQSVAGLTEQNATGTLGRERAGLLGQGRTLDAEQAAFKTGAYGDLRNEERTYGLARAAYNLKDQTAVQTAADKAAARRVSRANTRDRIAASQQNTQTRQTAAEIAAEKKRLGNVRATSQKAWTRIEDAAGRWDHYGQMRNPTKKISVDTQGKQTEQVVLDAKGNPVLKAPSTEQIRQQLIKDGFSAQEIRIALRVRSGHPLSSNEIDLAHQLGIRVPNKYRPKVAKTVNPTVNDVNTRY